MEKEYQEILKWLFSQLPSYQEIGEKALNNKLDKIISISDYLDNPHKKFKSIHIAGTNGKGSSAHMLSSILQEAGYKVGLYTSPHLKDFRERIKINSEEITKEEVISFVKENKIFFSNLKCSFFEMTVGLAFSYFAKNNVDIAVIETGLGGKLDATNIILPEVSLITNISLDHTFFLGDTIEKIAKEKAGIIKLKTPIVIGEKDINTENIFKEIAKEKRAPIYFIENKNKEFNTDLEGEFQEKNILSVLKVIEVLGWEVSKNSIKKGLNNVVKNTNLKGRWQVLKNSPKIVCDIAHNKAGIIKIINQLKKERYNNLHIVYGTSNDKNLDEIVPLLSKDAKYYLCEANINRSMPLEKLEKSFKGNNLIFEKFTSVKKAYNKAKEKASLKDLILITGSNFVVSEIL